ncbi:alpha/beta hydrolase [Dyella psychrodurans]|uniref:Alpha/beta hydrolase n=2 Tax=Dyella psychrodurans TaxID=1927960 RepID=A0A370XEZ6_9GAMM|nr:alpha/beta hydrolase [Dyella psychrodurans]
MLGVTGTPAVAAHPNALISTATIAVRYHTVDVNGIKIFYREAGDSSKPTILLLHGFPSSSHMYRDLLPLLSPYFHVVAPDYPGSGNSDAPSEAVFEPTFANLTTVTEGFVQKMSLKHFIIYMQDFGGPVGFRMAVHHPDWVRGFIIQNANAYLDGLSADNIKGIRSLEGELTPAGKQFADSTVEPQFTELMYRTGVRNAADLDPDAWKADLQTLQNPDSKRIQRALIINYHTNLDQYPTWQAYFKKYQPKALIVWGKNDQIFLPPGAEAYKRDLPKAEIHFFDTGHFALEEDASGIADQIIRSYGQE